MLSKKVFHKISLSCSPTTLNNIPILYRHFWFKRGFPIFANFAIVLQLLANLDK